MKLKQQEIHDFDKKFNKHFDSHFYMGCRHRIQDRLFLLRYAKKERYDRLYWKFNEYIRRRLMKVVRNYKLIG